MSFNFMRNLAIPPTAQIETPCFEECHDLFRLFGSQEKIECALKSRFDGLPIHDGLCYYHQHHPTEVVLAQLNRLFDKSPNPKRLKLGTSNETIDYDQDCLGTTPLHILACSTRHNLDLYQLIVDHCSESLITEDKDKWDCIPILYAILVWGNASQAFLQFLIDSQKASFPDSILNWDKMLAVLCR